MLDSIVFSLNSYNNNHILTFMNSLHLLKLLIPTFKSSQKYFQP